MPDINTEVPELRNDGEYTYLKARVNLGNGFPTIEGAIKFVREAGTYAKKVFLRKDEQQFSLHDVLSALGAATPRGGELEIMVEGTDRAAKRIAVRLYSGLISEDSYNPDFNLF